MTNTETTGSPTALPADVVGRLLADLFDRLHVLHGRYCLACHSDLSDPEVKAHAGWPTGGHAADCPAALLLVMVGERNRFTVRFRDAAGPEAAAPGS